MDRRSFLRLIELGIGFSFVFIWQKLSLFNTNVTQSEVKSLPLNKNKELSFFDDYIVVNKNNEIKVLSARCTHLGCTINKLENGVLVCPCHGSYFDLEGKPLKGPAYKSLKTIAAKISDDGKFIHLLSS